MGIIKLLGKAGLHSAIMRYAFHNQSVIKGEKMEYVFIDSEGRRYYKYEHEIELPMKRFSAIQECITELNSCMSVGEIDAFIEAMENALAETLRPVPGKKSGLPVIGFILTEMKQRRTELFRTDLLFKLAAISLIREDENPAEYNTALTLEKQAQFIKDSKSGLMDFFAMAGLSAYIPSVITTTEDLTAYLETARHRITATKKILAPYTTQHESLTDAETEIDKFLVS